jgi:3D (Asp-Asp-Asp) domain-containing protein
MMKCLSLVLAALSAGSTAYMNKTNTTASMKPCQRIQDVRTTAYTHTESDHVEYGTQSAQGGNLKYGKVRSAAADWSVYPVGTVFQIEGDSSVYEVDDYGSALVGTETIDIYKPSKATMNEWGVRSVNINVLQWGSFDKSLAILKPRERKAAHVRDMVHKIERGTPPAV